MENSLQAIEAAIAAKLPIEVDLQNTKDQKAVVFHDHTLKRLTNQSGHVNERSLDEMTALPLINNGTTISYSNLLALVDGRVPLLIELKDQDGKLGENLGSFLPDVIENTQQYKGAIALMSFNPYLVQALKKALPHHKIGLTTDEFSLIDWPKVPAARRARLRDLNEIAGLEFDFISHHWTDLERHRDLNKPKLCWTIKTQENAKIARMIADNITFEGYMPNHA